MTVPIKPVCPTLTLSAVRDHRAADAIAGIWEAMWHAQFAPTGTDILEPPPSEALMGMIDAMPHGGEAMTALSELLAEYDELKRKSREGGDVR